MEVAQLKLYWQCYFHWPYYFHPEAVLVSDDLGPMVLLSPVDDPLVVFSLLPPPEEESNWHTPCDWMLWCDPERRLPPAR